MAYPANEAFEEEWKSIHHSLDRNASVVMDSNGKTWRVGDKFRVCTNNHRAYYTAPGVSNSQTNQVTMKKDPGFPKLSPKAAVEFTVTAAMCYELKSTIYVACAFTTQATPTGFAWLTVSRGNEALCEQTWSAAPSYDVSDDEAIEQREVPYVYDYKGASDIAANWLDGLEVSAGLEAFTASMRARVDQKYAQQALPPPEHYESTDEGRQPSMDGWRADEPIGSSVPLQWAKHRLEQKEATARPGIWATDDDDSDEDLTVTPDIQTAEELVGYLPPQIRNRRFHHIRDWTDFARLVQTLRETCPHVFGTKTQREPDMSDFCYYAWSKQLATMNARKHLQCAFERVEPGQCVRVPWNPRYSAESVREEGFGNLNRAKHASIANPVPFNEGEDSEYGVFYHGLDPYDLFEVRNQNKLFGSSCRTGGVPFDGVYSCKHRDRPFRVYPGEDKWFSMRNLHNTGNVRKNFRCLVGFTCTAAPFKIKRENRYFHQWVHKPAKVQIRFVEFWCTDHSDRQGEVVIDRSTYPSFVAKGANQRQKKKAMNAEKQHWNHARKLIHDYVEDGLGGDFKLVPNAYSTA